LFLGLWLAPAAAGATILSDWSLEQVLGHADRVVLGLVVEQRAVRGARHPLTESVVRVDRVLKGEACDRLVVSQYGGRQGDVTLRIPGDPRLEVGQRVVLITRRARDGRAYLVGMSLGAFRVDGDRLVQSVDVPLLGADGQVRPPPGTRSLRLDELEAAIRRAR
jgi:hypothetical protein